MDCCHPAPDGLKHPQWGVECALSMFRGFRNAVMAGTRIRLPYILNALAYALIFRSEEYVNLFLLELAYAFEALGRVSSS